MALGMAVPLVVAYLICKLHLGSEPHGPEMLNPIERERLEARDNKRAELPFPALRLPEETTETKEADQD